MDESTNQTVTHSAEIRQDYPNVDGSMPSLSPTAPSKPSVPPPVKPKSKNLMLLQRQNNQTNNDVDNYGYQRAWSSSQLQQQNYNDDDNYDTLDHTRMSQVSQKLK